MTNAFQISDKFISQYKTKTPDWGFNGLGDLVYQRTYSRVKENDEKEQWWETCRRVVEWVYGTQQKHIESNCLGWKPKKAQLSAQEMYDRMFNFKWLPPGRGLWIAGTSALEEKPIGAALNNCAFVSTENMYLDPAKPFCFLMDMSMLGVGVGFDVKGAGTVTIQNVDSKTELEFQIPDSREGWVEALRLLLNSYFVEAYNKVKFDYSLIRPYGTPIKGFGGTASGHEPLKKLFDDIASQFKGRAGETLTQTDIVDLQNKIGCCVVAGNVRRTAEIVLGDANSLEYMKLKDYRWDSDKQEYVGDNARRSAWGWASNNSVLAEIGMDYSNVAKQIQQNGEPGLVWLETAKQYSRLCDPKDLKDLKSMGCNPCVEQTLESYELCCLVETFPTRHENEADYMRTLKFAYLYAKTVTLQKTHWAETNRVLLRNRRIGTSMSGVAQMIDNYGIAVLKSYCENGFKTIENYDKIYSDWLCVPKSRKTTSVKPSGTVSLLAGCTPGIHFPENTTYIRRVRLSADSDLIKPLMDAGYHIEKAKEDETGKTLLVEFPVHVTGVRRLADVSMWEQLSIAAFMQKYWADNQVSATITFDPETEGHQIEHALDMFQYQLKGVSFLPRVPGGVYHQAPYEAISQGEYEIRTAGLKAIQWNKAGEEAIGEKFCSNDSCEIGAKSNK